MLNRIKTALGGCFVFVVGLILTPMLMIRYCRVIDRAHQYLDDGQTDCPHTAIDYALLAEGLEPPQSAMSDVGGRNADAASDAPAAVGLVDC